MPRLRANGIEAEATINKLSTNIQPTLANKMARAEGMERTPSEPVARGDWEFDRKKEESAIILYTLANEKTRRYKTPPFKKMKSILSNR